MAMSAVAIRLPAHGTVPGALTAVEWEEWLAATRLAVREARRRAGPSKPLHIVGFSNGGALALKYALDALGDETLPKPDRLVLISPMIGLTSFARFAGLAGLPSILPAFAKAAWLAVLPEFNPFKYNSFPINGARQAHRLTVALQERIALYARDGRIERLPPILTFQSVMDFTVTTRAVVSALYVHLPANGSELVLFDLNRAAKLSPLLRTSTETMLTRILPAPPRRFRTTILTNASADSSEVVAQVLEAGALTPQTQTAGPLLSGRHVLAVARGAAVSTDRRVVWDATRRFRGFRDQPRGDRRARRAWRSHPEPGLVAARFLEPVLSLCDATHRGRDRRQLATRGARQIDGFFVILAARGQAGYTISDDQGAQPQQHQQPAGH